MKKKLLVVLAAFMAAAFTVNCGGGGGGGEVDTGTPSGAGTLSNPYVLQLGQTYNITVMREQLICGPTFNLTCPDFDKDYVSTKFTVPADGEYRLSVTGVEPANDAVLYIYKSENPTSTTINYVAKVDASGKGGSEIAEAVMPVDYYYYVFLQMWNGADTVQVKIEQISSTPPATAPAAPSNIAVTNITQNGARLSWTDNSGNETGFEIGTCLIPRCSIISCSCDSFNKVGEVGANVTTYQIAGLTSARSYTYAVRAYNGVGVSGNVAASFSTP